MEIKVDVKLKVMDMYNFFMYHTYTRASGIFSLLIGVAVAVMFFATYGEVDSGQSLLYLVFTIFFLIYNPVSFYWKALKQIKTVPIFQNPITYKFDKAGIVTMQNGESAKVEWQDVVKVVTTKRSLIVYLSKVRASILPKEQIGADYEAVVKLIRDNVEESKVKIK